MDILILIIFLCYLGQKNKYLKILPSVKENSIINKFSNLQPEKINQDYSSKNNELPIKYNNTQQMDLLKKLKKKYNY